MSPEWSGDLVKEAATQVLIERAQPSEGWGRMFSLSLAGHLVALAMLLLVPEGWWQPVEQGPGAVMTVTLGGPPRGPGEGGMTPLGGRPIQQVLPLPEARRPQAIRPPAPEPPEMTVPEPEARRRATPETDVESAPPEARGRTPTQGEETQPGSAMAETGTQGTGVGLSAGGGGLGGYLDVGDFCCPDYLATTLDLIGRRWDSNQRVMGDVLIKFTIQRNGSITDVGSRTGESTPRAQSRRPARCADHAPTAASALSVHRGRPHGSLDLRVPTLMLHHGSFARVLAFVAASALLAASHAPSQDRRRAAEQRSSEVNLIIGDSVGAPPTIAVPDFLALSQDPETVAAAKTISQVLWDDLNFEREFRMIPRDTYQTIRPARSLTDVSFDEWAELGADGVVIGTVMKVGDQQRVRARLFNVRLLESAFGREYEGGTDDPRLYAHELSDEIHRHQRGLEGVARTKLAFISDRARESIAGPIENRTVKELYLTDYDGANVRRVTVTHSLNVAPAWSADARAIAYTSWRRGYPDIFVSNLYEGTMTSPAGGTAESHNFLPAWSPDGSTIAFTSNRDGNSELYVVKADGSDLRRVTTHPAIDTSPTWSPTGNQIAFTSDRTGSPQVYVVGADGTGIRRLTYEVYCDRPTWSPDPYNEIAYTSRTSSGGHDIKILDLATNQVRQITFGVGSNESPSFSPNGRHLAFTSNRAGGEKHIFTIGRDGRGLRQVTKVGNNEMASWSP